MSRARIWSASASSCTVCPASMARRTAWSRIMSQSLGRGWFRSHRSLSASTAAVIGLRARLGNRKTSGPPTTLCAGLNGCLRGLYRQVVGAVDIEALAYGPSFSLQVERAVCTVN
jgi:hypothetical protein